MKTRLLALLVLALPLSTLSTDKPAPLPTVTTVRRSAIQVGSSSFALVKGTKLEMIGREGKMLLVKYRTSQGKIPYADTDYVLSEDEKNEEEAAEEAPAPVAPTKQPAPPASKPAAPLPAVAKHLPDDGQDKSRTGSNQQRETAGQTPGGQQPTTVPPPALATAGIRPSTAGPDPVPTAVGNRAPTSTYGKMVQKAKQAEQAHNDKLVKPADEILDEKPKK